VAVIVMVVPGDTGKLLHPHTEPETMVTSSNSPFRNFNAIPIKTCGNFIWDERLR
jgi:hypothetical protein